MFPSQTQMFRRDWWSAPNFDYTMKHSFSWPHPPTARPLPAYNHLASVGATETAALAASAGGAHIPPGGSGMYYHPYGYVPFGPRHFGRGRGFGMRRLIWVSLLSRARSIVLIAVCVVWIGCRSCCILFPTQGEAEGVRALNYQFRGE